MIQSPSTSHEPTSFDSGIIRHISGDMEKIKDTLDRIARLSLRLDAKDIPALGEILNTFSDFKNIPENPTGELFKKTVSLLKNYLEKLVLESTDDLEPYKTGLALLRGLYHSLSSGSDFGFDTAEVFEQLGNVTDESESEFVIEDMAPIEGKDEFYKISVNDDDVPILRDFITESRDNLESIEVKLVDLEQNPSDKEIINDIFRPFHTIKGVAGFLELKSINKLAHKTENILDSARTGEFIINDSVTDVILESIDTLRKMLSVIEEGLDQGQAMIENQVAYAPLLERIDTAVESACGQKYAPIGKILVDRGEINKNDLDMALEKQRSHPEKRIGEILIEDKAAKPKSVISALRDQRSTSKNAVQVKVDTKKLDNLVDLTGELVIAQSMLKQKIQDVIKDQQFSPHLSQLGQIVTGIQKTAMSMRMIPIGSTFQRMVRLIRDLSRNSGKQVDLKMFGEDTEIDRNVVDALYEPLVHMVRNAVDHGIESPDEREKSGKDRSATVKMRAYHKSGHIVIEIEDDGKGLNKQKIIEKAINGNLIKPDEELKDSEIYDLIMHPGFSTADKITDISGRGVGMDVVKKTIEGLQGGIEILSQEGLGSTFKITLPLTLAIIEGMLVRVGVERYIVPTLSILESFRPGEKDYFTVEGKGEMIMFRKNLIPMLRLDKIFGLNGKTKDPWEGLIVVVENKSEQRGLLLDELLGKEEFVIKSLGESFKNVTGISGGSIMGDGRIGLILDMEGLFKSFQ